MSSDLGGGHTGLLCSPNTFFCSFLGLTHCSQSESVIFFNFIESFPIWLLCWLHEKPWKPHRFWVNLSGLKANWIGFSYLSTSILCTTNMTLVCAFSILGLSKKENIFVCLCFPFAFFQFVFFDLIPIFNFHKRFSISHFMK